jgi:Tol biopolymer transport system component
VCLVTDGYVPDPELAGIWALDPRTEQRQRLFPDDGTLAWSPDGSQLVIAAGELYVVEVDGSNLTRITSTGTNHLAPSWSPCGEWIAFDDGWDVWVVRADGGDARKLDAGQGGAQMPSWSGDGACLLHIRWVDQNMEIFSMSADGTKPIRITRSRGVDEREPVFSPDGRRIAYTRVTRGQWPPQIYVMDADGRHARQLTVNGGTHPSWSPDGHQLVFARANRMCGEPDFGVLWTIDVNTQAELRLTRATAPWCDEENVGAQ